MKIALFHESVIAKTDISCFAIALSTNNEYDKHTFYPLFPDSKTVVTAWSNTFQNRLQNNQIVVFFVLFFFVLKSIKISTFLSL